jgi:hypothetical protein
MAIRIIIRDLLLTGRRIERGNQIHARVASRSTAKAWLLSAPIRLDRRLDAASDLRQHPVARMRIPGKSARESTVISPAIPIH